MHSCKSVLCNSEYHNFHKQLFNKEVESIVITLKSFMVWYILVDDESNGTLKTVTEIPDRSFTNGSGIVRQFLSGDTISNLAGTIRTTLDYL